MTFQFLRVGSEVFDSLGYLTCANDGGVQCTNAKDVGQCSKNISICLRQNQFSLCFGSNFEKRLFTMNTFCTWNALKALGSKNGEKKV